MDRSKLSLKWLEVFQAVARHGSVRGAAKELGVSVSTASHHLTCLETAVGATLLDHGKRPMRLTHEGETLVKRVDEAMWLLRKGVSEIWSDNLHSLVRVLRIAQIEDFDADVCPALVAELARAMPACEFSLLSRPSHEIFELLLSEQVDVGIASSAEFALAGLEEEPILSDPYVLVTPMDLADEPTELWRALTSSHELPFLRHSKHQLIGRRVEAQLRRMGLRLPRRMEFESTRTILSMVADGRGWCITTALNCGQAHRHHGRIRLEPFPGKSFSRQISVLRRDDLPDAVFSVLTASLRRAVQHCAIEPTVARHPWLSGGFGLIAPPAVPRAPEGGRLSPE